MALVLALGAMACGSDDGNGGGGDDRAEARATVESLYASIREGDAAGVCSTLTEPAQEQIAAGGLGAKKQSCTDAFQAFLDQADKAGGLNLTLKAKVESVKVDGDKAVAKVSFGKGPSGEIPLVKNGDEWKLDRVGTSQ